MLNKIYLLFIIVLIGCSTTKLPPVNNVNCNFEDSINLNDFNLSAEIRKKLMPEKNLKHENDSVIIEIATYFKSITKKSTNIKKVFIYDEKDGKLEYYYYYYYNLEIGKKRYYNKEGELVKVVNNRDEEHYPICFKKALGIFNKMKKGNGTIGLSKESIKKYGKVIYTWEGYDFDDRMVYIINAKTGKKISEEKSYTGPVSNLKY